MSDGSFNGRGPSGCERSDASECARNSLIHRVEGKDLFRSDLLEGGFGYEPDPEWKSKEVLAQFV